MHTIREWYVILLNPKHEIRNKFKIQISKMAPAYRGCQRNVPIEDRFSATNPYTAILFSEHYYDKRYKPLNWTLSLCFEHSSLWQKNRSHPENTKSEKHEMFHDLFRGFDLSWFRDKKSFSFPVYPGFVFRYAYIAFIIRWRCIILLPYKVESAPGPLDPDIYWNAA